MKNFFSFSPPPDYCRFNQMQKPYKTLDEALILVKNAIHCEREDELFYDYLISMSPTREEENIITTIRNDERKHNNYFKEIYKYYTKENITESADIAFEKPTSYIEGVIKSKFGELSAVERYRDIRAGLPTEYYKDMVFEILTDELKHADKYDYILYLNHTDKTSYSTGPTKSLTTSEKKPFSLEKANAIATVLGIDFAKEKFDLEQFRMGLDVELEHGRKYDPTNITNDDPIATGKIALAHLTEFPDYYNRITKLEEEAKAYWSSRYNVNRQMREFTLNELSRYDGSMGKPAYVAVNGIVYDVSNVPSWGGGSHFGLQAGKDLTEEFQNCHSIEKLQNLIKVGIIKT